MASLYYIHFEKTGEQIILDDFPQIYYKLDDGTFLRGDTVICFCPVCRCPQLCEHLPFLPADIDRETPYYEIIQRFVEQRVSPPRCIVCGSPDVTKLDLLNPVYVNEIDDRLTVTLDGRMYHGGEVKYVLDMDGNRLRRVRLDWEDVADTIRKAKYFMPFFGQESARTILARHGFFPPDSNL